MPFATSPLAGCRSLSGAALLVLACATASAATTAPVQPPTTPLALVYTPANTYRGGDNFIGVSVSPDGQRLTVKTTPVNGQPSGNMSFGGYPYYVGLASFLAVGGGPGRAFCGDVYRGTAPLTASAGKPYLVGTLAATGGNVYVLTPVAMTGIRRGHVGTWSGTLTGTVTTDGTRGNLNANHVVDFDIHIDGVQP